jgi:hypothetical protein
VELVKWTGIVVGSGYTEYHTFGAVHVEVIQSGVIQDQYNQTNYIVANPTTGNSEVQEIDLLFGTGPTSNAIGHLESFDGLSWVLAGNWRYGTSGTFRQHGQLLAEEVLGAQAIPVPRFLAQMRGVYEAHYRMQHISTDYYIFLGGSFDVPAFRLAPAADRAVCRAALFWGRVSTSPRAAASRNTWTARQKN